DPERDGRNGDHGETQRVQVLLQTWHIDSPIACSRTYAKRRLTFRSRCLQLALQVPTRPVEHAQQVIEVISPYRRSRSNLRRYPPRIGRQGTKVRLGAGHHGPLRSQLAPILLSFSQLLIVTRAKCQVEV